MLDGLDAARPGGPVGYKHFEHGEQACLVGPLDGGHSGGQEAAGPNIDQVIHRALVLRYAVAAVDVHNGELVRLGDCGYHQAELSQFDIRDDGDFGIAGQKRAHLLGTIEGSHDGVSGEPCAQGAVHAGNRFG